MKRRTEAWYRNPFRLGGLGMLVLLAGYLLLRTAVGDGETTVLTVIGRLTYLAGLLAVGTAGVLWFVQARQPDQPIEDEASEEDDPPGDFAEAGAHEDE